MGLIKALQARGATVHAIAPRDKYSKLLEDEGCIYHELRMDSRGANPFRDLLLLFELIRIYRRVRPGVILHYTVKPNIYGTLAARILKIPSINNVCGLGTAFMKKGLLSFIVPLMYRVAFYKSKKIFFQNADDKDLFIHHRLVDHKIVDLLPGSGINIEKFSVKPGEKQDSRPFTFLMVARLIKDKGVFEYVEAAKKLKIKGIDARFQLLGALDTRHKRGIAADVVSSWVDESYVEYLGVTDNVSAFIHESDCVVLPSYREGTPRTLLEGASMGKPLVATDVPGCNSVVINDHNGYLCRARDIEDLTEKLSRMYHATPEERRSMGQRSRRLIEEQFDEKLVIDKYEQAIDSLIAS